MTMTVCSFLTMSKPLYDGKGWKSNMEKTLSTSSAASGTRQCMLCHAVFVPCICNSIDSVSSVFVLCCVNAGGYQILFFPDAVGFKSD